MADLDLAYLPAGELAERIAAGALSPVEVMRNALERIEAVRPALNPFCEVWGDEALGAARAAERQVGRGPLGPLHGVPVAVKDTTPTRGHRTTLGSRTHADWVPDRDAWVAAALRRAGAILVGTTTTPEFAHSLITDSPLWGVTRNPWDPTRTPGGSSGGSAVAVATGCVALAEGSDMGGSVRIPAAWCGIVGLKPGLGRIPVEVIPGAFETISHHGPLARTVDDARRFLAAAQGPDDGDPLSVTAPLDLRGPTPSSVEGTRLALSVDLGCWAVDPDIEAGVRRAADALRDAGAVVEEVELPMTPRDEGVWIELWRVFMAAYYGHLVAEHRESMDPDLLALVERGERIGAAEYKRLEIDRADLWRRVAAVLADHEALLCPTMATAPYPAAKADRPRITPVTEDGRYHAPDMTAVFNLVSPCPAISVPCGWDSAGLPIGLQVVARRWREDTALRVARAVEVALPEGRGRPPV